MNDNSGFIPLEESHSVWRSEAIRLPEKDGSTSLAWLRTDETKGARRTFVKQLRPELRNQSQYRALFYKEYEIGARLSSAHIPTYYDLEDSNDGDMAIVMEYVEGMTLAEILEVAPKRFQKSEDIRTLVVQLVEAVQTLHHNNVLHLDIKPENIIIASHTGVVMLVDLGFAFTPEWPETIGRTLRFAAPEQKNGNIENIGPHTDIFSVGSIAQYVALECGASLSADLAEIVSRCTADDIGERFARAEDVAAALAADVRNSKRHTVWMRGAFLLLACALVIAALALTDESRLNTARKCITGGYYALVSDATFTRDTLRYHVLSWTEATVEVVRGDDYEVLGDADIPSVVNDGHRDYEVRSIGDNAFSHCNKLLSVVFPSTLKKIERSAFAHCPQLSTVNLPIGLVQLGDSAFTCCKHLREVHIPPTVRRIPVRCFSDCEPGLRAVSVPRGVTTIERDAFCGSHHLRRIELPEGLTSIGRGAFWRCSELDSVVIPSTVAHYGDFCFQGCDSLHTMTLLSPRPVETTNILAEKGGQPNIDLYVPESSLGLYRNVFPWNMCRVFPLSKK